MIDSLSGSGKYRVDVLVGDSMLATALQWNGAGTLDLTVANPSPAATRDSTTDAAAFAAKPDIVHAFRAPEPRAPMLLALIGTGGVIALLAGLILAVRCVRACVRAMRASVSHPCWRACVQLLASGLKIRVPSDAMDFMYTGAFLCSIAAIILLYWLYWVVLNIFQALGALAILSAVTLLTGQRALKMAHDRSRKGAAHAHAA